MDRDKMIEMMRYLWRASELTSNRDESLMLELAGNLIEAALTNYTGKWQDIVEALVENHR